MSLGVWEEFGISGAVCMHSILLPNEKILCVERPHVMPYPFNSYTNSEISVEINLKASKTADGKWESNFTVVPVNDMPVCGGHSQRADGTIGFFGGDRTKWSRADGTDSFPEGHFASRTYTPCKTEGCVAGNWTNQEDMTTARWYPTVTTLYNGHQIIVGGLVGYLDLTNPVGNNPTWEYWPAREKLNQDESLDGIRGLLEWCFPFCMYPMVVQLPSGGVFVMANSRSVTLDIKTDISKATAEPLDAPNHAPWIYPYSPTFTVLPMTAKNNYRFVIQICGGNELDDSNRLASKQCWQLAPEESKIWTRVEDMPQARVMPDSVILPDGKILYLNGAAWGNAGGAAGECSYTNVKCH
jgi:hypothetical protein